MSEEVKRAQLGVLRTEGVVFEEYCNTRLVAGFGAAVIAQYDARGKLSSANLANPK
jgi:hypothetical protein